MASKSKTYELALKIAGKVDSSLKKSCLAAAKDVNTLSASVQKTGRIAAKAMAAVGTAVANFVFSAGVTLQTPELPEDYTAISVPAWRVSP